MSAGVFILLFWLGMQRFDVKRELVPVSKSEWEKIYRNERSAIC